MEIEIFTLCDAATDQSGKLNIIGTFDTIYTQSFPTLHGACAVVLRVRFSRIEFRKHQIAIHFVDNDGNAILPPLEGVIEVRAAPKSHFAATNLIINLQSIRLEKEGEYSVDLAIDGEEKASLPLIARLTEKRG